MENKELYAVISSSPMALVYPQMAEACISADVTAEMFDKIHTCIMGEPAPALARESSAEDMDNDKAIAALLSVPAH
ncbi:TPA: hypothetical protein ACIVON_001425 [Salmonella enterica subsp. enterica serovar Poona]|nr:hypothetical protein [Salmonella enterica]EKB5041448.1 hypothetical protein [Salmonella enterica]EME1067598.1 hypothetical protein [Salmonella enterica]HEC9415927.1 hypothetical protein [Salmonella enterica subsp. enterica serovar Poona]